MVGGFWWVGMATHHTKTNGVSISMKHKPNGERRAVLLVARLSLVFFPHGSRLSYTSPCTVRAIISSLLRGSPHPRPTLPLPLSPLVLSVFSRGVSLPFFCSRAARLSSHHAPREVHSPPLPRTCASFRSRHAQSRRRTFANNTRPATSAFGNGARLAMSSTRAPSGSLAKPACSLWCRSASF